MFIAGQIVYKSWICLSLKQPANGWPEMIKSSAMKNMIWLARLDIWYVYIYIYNDWLADNDLSWSPTLYRKYKNPPNDRIAKKTRTENVSKRLQSGSNGLKSEKVSVYLLRSCKTSSAVCETDISDISVDESERTSLYQEWMRNETMYLCSRYLANLFSPQTPKSLNFDQDAPRN
jgi:hypothetical protein